jgi:CBS domain-containing protein
MNQLADILDDKGDQVLRIDANASVFEAIERMVEANVGSLLVTEGGEIDGSSPNGTTSAVSRSRVAPTRRPPSARSCRRR